ncbi:MAG: hypothetical protein WC676_08660 [Candidatus Omnitrophota bacterium]
MTIRNLFFGIFIALFCIQAGEGAQESPWQQLKGKHFVVYYNFKQDEPAARKILNASEDYYDKITRKIGYARHTNSWTWEERVRIIIFADQAAFSRSTGQPAWSRGYADSDSYLFHSRLIATFRQEEGFIDGILPHEISHLVLRDFVGFEVKMPLWFEEGVAQFYESDKRSQAQEVMPRLVAKKMYIPFDVFMNWDIRKVKDQSLASLFYGQSVSVVDFLMKKYGSDSFGLLCRYLREGRTMAEALRGAYPRIRSVQDFENDWVVYLK